MNTLKITVLMAALTGLLIGLAHILGLTYGGGPEAAQSWMLTALVICGVMNFVMYWFSDKIVLSMYKARQISPSDAPKLYNMVERLAQKEGMPMPKVYIIPTASPNAFATGRSPSNASVAATEGIMRLLSDEELEGVMAHELAHVKNRDTLISTIAATLGGAVSFLARSMMFSGGGRSRNSNNNALTVVLSLVAMILAPLVAMMIQMAVSRSREYKADATGARICGNPNALARALERLQSGVASCPMQMGSPATSHMFIVNSFGRGGGGMGKLFSTHPPMEERVRRLRAMEMRD